MIIERPEDLVQFTEENGFDITEPVSPSEFGKITEIDGITDDISIAKFDEIVADGHNLWNFPLDEYEYTQKNGYKIVAVKFKEGYRLVQLEEA